MASQEGRGGSYRPALTHLSSRHVDEPAVRKLARPLKADADGAYVVADAQITSILIGNGCLAVVLTAGGPRATSRRGVTHTCRHGTAPDV